MMNARFRLIDRTALLRSAAFAVGLASAAMAHAQPATSPERANPERAKQTVEPAPSASADVPAPSDPMEGVTVTGRRPDAGAPIPADKRAEYDAEVARQAAFRAYRESTPRVAGDDKGVGDPNDLSKDFPGLQGYLPK
jgi:hypothetical protein